MCNMLSKRLFRNRLKFFLVFCFHIIAVLIRNTTFDFLKVYSLIKT